ncbi:MAG: DUF4301 family protein [Bacteroidales bacterium]|nr:DUF4301 family protein [Bacteroidales bacterium]
MFSDKDVRQIENKDMTLNDVIAQINKFKLGFPFIQLSAPATPAKGVLVFNENEVEALSAYFDINYTERELMKFVPASGAASRMFKNLFHCLENCNGNEDQKKEFLNDKGFDSVWYFFEHIHDFAFYPSLKNIMAENGEDIELCLKDQNYISILNYLLTDKGLNYASLPKGLLHFHKYDKGNRLAVEEHLVEAAVYGRDKNDIARVHFTVSPEHMDKFKAAVEKCKGKYEEQYGVRFEVEFSIQKSSTDTIAVNPDNTPFRESNGDLLFRPGGHGALIENLNDLNSDIVFIKNIDNIVPDSLKHTTFIYKKALAGYLIEIQNKLFDFLDILDEGTVTEDELDEIKNFTINKLNLDIDVDYFNSIEFIEKVDYLFNLINRPIRVCGMVKNEGEPGGGPFWVLNEEGENSLQIVESSQINFDKPSQKEMVSKATHFNPVDLVCGVRDFQGENFDLHEFIDQNTGFISEKSKDGKNLKAMELPGLWNGAMANWITIFVETPIITFNPVKIVNDLLRDQHQA